MPKSLDGKRLSAKEHRQWKKVRSRSGSAAAATSAVQKGRRTKKQ